MLKSQKQRKYKHIKTKEMFIERSRAKHGDKYDYSKVEFPDRGYSAVSGRKLANYDGDTAVTISCPKHGEYPQRPRKHLEGSGCHKCASETTAAALAGRESTIVYEKNFYNNTLRLPRNVREKIIHAITERKKAEKKSVTHTFELHSPTHGTVEVLIDKIDWPRVSLHTWSLNKAHIGRSGQKQFYINTRIPRPDLPRLPYTTRSGQQRTYQRYSTLALARFLMDPDDGLIVDHINGNPHDNRKHNLRVCTYTDNNANTRKKRGESRFKGVNRHRRNKTNPWSAYCRMGGKTVNLGSYALEEDAARVYDIMALTTHGEYAYINFPIEEYLYGDWGEK